jgi:two-component system sensor histidine kinase UhpB
VSRRQTDSEKKNEKMGYVYVPIFLMKRNVIIIVSMAFVFVVICLLIVDLHRLSEKEVVSQFQEHQLSHARYLAGQIKSYFESRQSGLRAFSSFPSLQYSDPIERGAYIEAYLRQLKKVHVKAISVLDERGTIIDSTDPKNRGLNLAQRDFFSWAKKKENRGKVFVSPSFPETPAHSFKVLLVTPIYQNPSDGKRSKAVGKFVGAFLVMIDFEEFLSRQLTSIDPSTNLHQVWIIDKEGTLLFQSKHKDMVLRNIYQRDKSCNQCHTSFDYAEKILKEREGKADYRIKNFANKLAAFAPVEFENAPWIVVVNSPYNEVMAFVRKSLRGHLMLLGIIVSVLVAGFILLNRSYQQMLKAEEEARHWREKRDLEDKIQQSDLRSRTIVETAHDIIWTLDSQGNFTSLNRSGETISGYTASELIGKNFAPLIYPEDLPMLQDLHAKIFRGEEASGEARVYAKGGSLFTLSVNAVPLFENDRVIGMAGLGRDVTENKKAEDTLRRNEEKYRTLVETMNEGLVIIDENGLWTYANDKLCYMLGHFQGELVGRPVIDFVDEADQAMFKQEMAMQRKGEHKPYELIWKNKNGMKIPTIVSPKPILGKEGEFNGSFAIITDITERKQAEEALRESEEQLRYLSSQLMTIQEQERKRISAELHDELGQALAVMKLRLKVIEKSLREDQDTTRKDCEETLHYIDQVIENVRRLSRDLSPSILEDLGFSAALRRMVSEFTKHHYIKSSLDIFDIDHLFSPRTHILLYRIFQETLTNIGKHSRASQVTISIRKQNGGISFLIGDDGKGFNIEEVSARNITERGLGLATLSERIRMLGGSLHLWSQEGKGTRISFTIPIEERQ